ncbi:hypothetical protein [Streptomyces sp. DSM 118878]
MLHISLRDLLPESLLDAHNIVDDADHAVRERTSLALAVQAAGHRDFIDPEIGRLLLDEGSGGAFTPERGRTIVYGPFGLGVLDIALADAVLAAARTQGLGVEVEAPSRCSEVRVDRHDTGRVLAEPARQKSLPHRRGAHGPAEAADRVIPGRREGDLLIESAVDTWSNALFAT